MKNFLRSSFYVALFIVSGVVFQISCSNSDDSVVEDTPAAGKIVYTQRSDATQSIWTCNLDGTEKTQVPITLPSDRDFYDFYSSDQHSTVRFSADGQKIVFTASGPGANYIYTCDLDGANLSEIVVSPSTAIFVEDVN